MAADALTPNITRTTAAMIIVLALQEKNDMCLPQGWICRVKEQGLSQFWEIIENANTVLCFFKLNSAWQGDSLVLFPQWGSLHWWHEVCTIGPEALCQSGAPPTFHMGDTIILAWALISIIWCLASTGNPIVEMRQLYDRLISTMGIPILVR